MRLKCLFFFWVFTTPYLAVAGDFSGECSGKTVFAFLPGIKLTRIESDGVSNSLHYKNVRGRAGSLQLVQNNTATLLPPVVYINGKRARLEDLAGHRIQRLRVLKKTCRFYHPLFGEKKLTTHWLIRAQIAEAQT